VEDSLRGLLAARAAGLRCIIIPSKLTLGSDFTGAHAVIDHIAQLPAVLSAL
jgi:beta-phosphoglucomutase-like phosphatase (HAD superfamily)